MADGLYVGMAGAAARAEQLDALSDNLANAQTPGFKAARPAFESFLSSAGANDKVYSAAVATGFDLRPGPSVRTGEPLDITPEGGAFLAVKTDAGVAFTRNGRLNFDANGVLRSGPFEVLDTNGQPLALPVGATGSITQDGTVLASGQPIGQLSLHELSGTMDRVGPALLTPSGNGSARMVSQRVLVGELEGSNFTPLEAAVTMVTAQRNYDASMQALQTAKRMDDRANELGRVR